MERKRILLVNHSEGGNRWRYGLLAAFTALIFGAALFSPALPQPLGYHNFADQRTIFGLPHFWNVASNLPFAVIGIAGCIWLLGKRGAAAFSNRRDWAAYFAFFSGEFLTCFGSAYYHAAPGNETLVWDRLVFSLLLTSFFVIVVGELLSKRAARTLLAPMLLLGVFSVVQWHWTEVAGVGDMRLYLLVQFYPVLAIPLIAALFGGGSAAARMALATWAFYGVAKICELLDAPIFDLTGFWSGHTFKHFIAAAATLSVLRFLTARRAAAAPLVTVYRERQVA